MKRVLFFNPYTPWTPHLMWEVTLSYALKQRGHQVRFITCSGLPDCGMVPAARSEGRSCCGDCCNISETLATRLRQKVEFMQAGVTAAVRQDIRQWADGLRLEELRSACFRGLDIGRWTWPDMITYWHNTEPDLARPEVEKSCRDLLYGAALAAASLPAIYDRQRPDVVVTLNGAFFLQRVAVELAWRRGIRTVAHERGWRDNTVTFRADGLAGDLDRYQRYWEAWKAIPLSASEIAEVHDLLLQRRSGKNMNWSAFSITPQERSKVWEQLRLPDRPTALLCTSSDCEGSIADRNGQLDQWTWIQATVAWFKTRPDYNLVIRVHPNELSHADVEDFPLRRYETLRATAPDNVRVVMPCDAISTYTLMDLATAGLSFGSTAGLEIAALGKPVAHAGTGMYRECGFVAEITRLEEVCEVTERVMTAAQSPEIRRQAYRYLHLMYLRLCVPFPAVRVSKDYYNAVPTYDSTAELAPGRDPYLDAITEYILGERDLYPPPSIAEVERSQDAEDAFFAQQA